MCVCFCGSHTTPSSATTLAVLSRRAQRPITGDRRFEITPLRCAISHDVASVLLRYGSHVHNTELSREQTERPGKLCKTRCSQKACFAFLSDEYAFLVGCKFFLF